MAFAKKYFSKTVSANSSVDLILNAKNTATDEKYIISNIKITSNGLKSATIVSEKIEIASTTESSIRIYPNPASSMLNIDFGDAEISKEVKVFNTLGQLIFSVQTKNSTAQIDVKLLKLKGIVMVQVIAGNAVSNHRVLVK